MSRLALLWMGLLCGTLSMLTSQAADGGTLNVTGPTNIVWNDGLSPRITLLLEAPAGSSENVAGFELELTLEGVPGEFTGELRFNTVTIADNNYIFDGNSLMFSDPDSLPIPVGSTSITSFFDFPADGSQTVDPEHPYGLATFDLDATALPSGYFQVVLSAYTPLASWYVLDEVGEVAFDNAPPRVVAIIGINVEAEPAAVPESSTLQLSGVAVAMLLAGGALRHRRRTNRAVDDAR